MLPVLLNMPVCVLLLLLLLRVRGAGSRNGSNRRDVHRCRPRERRGG